MSSTIREPPNGFIKLNPSNSQGIKQTSVEIRGKDAKLIVTSNNIAIVFFYDKTEQNRQNLSGGEKVNKHGV